MVSDQLQIYCWFNSVFRPRTKEALKLRVLALGESNSLVTGGFSPQRTGDLDNVSMPWRLTRFPHFLLLSTGSINTLSVEVRLLWRSYRIYIYIYIVIKRIYDYKMILSFVSIVRSCDPLITQGHARPTRDWTVYIFIWRVEYLVIRAMRRMLLQIYPGAVMDMALVDLQLMDGPWWLMDEHIDITSCKVLRTRKGFYLNISVSSSVWGPNSAITVKQKGHQVGCPGRHRGRCNAWFNVPSDD